jgi:hypothetical protein
MLLIGFCLATPAFARSSSGALLYGYSRFNDADKDAQNTIPRGQSFKALVGNRTEILEIDLMLRHSSLAEDLTFAGKSGELDQQNTSVGAQLGIWLLPWIQPHVGYAFHWRREKVNGDFSVSEQETLKQDYGLRDKTAAGLYGGADLVLVKFHAGHLFANYDYYHFNMQAAHQWEMMLGLRFYTDAPEKASKSEPSVFGNLIKALFRIK